MGKQSALITSTSSIVYPCYFPSLFIPVSIPLSEFQESQTHTVSVISEVFLKYDVSWNCLLVYLSFKKLPGHFFGKGFTWLIVQCRYKKTYTTLLMSINYVADIVWTLVFRQKEVLWKHYCQPVNQLVKTNFSRKHLIGILWNFM